MATGDFAVYKYKHGQSAAPSGGRLWLACGLLLGGLVFILWITALGIVMLIGGVWLMLGNSLANGLMIGPRYLICGNTILYYRNLRRVASSRKGVLELYGTAATPLRIEQSRFPTNARKTDKIERNTRAKFDKATALIVRRALAQAPDVQIAGVALPHPEGDA